MRSKKRLTEGIDPELSLIFYLFRVHHWTPEMYANLSLGGQDLVWGMALREAELLQGG